MKINGVSPSFIKSSYNTKRNINATGEKRVRRDTVNISDMGRKLSKIDMLSGEDRDKLISEVREKIENGTYNVDSEVLAKKLMGFINNKEV